MPTDARRLVRDDLFRRLCRVRDQMHANHAEPLRLRELAKTAGLSRFHFLRTFREAFGTTPHAYLTAVRLDRAKRLLAADHSSVTSVCFEVGFSSLGSFSGLFAERVGCPPGAWRRHLWQVQRRHRAVPVWVPWCFFDRFAVPESESAESTFATSEKPGLRFGGRVGSNERNNP